MPSWLTSDEGRVLPFDVCSFTDLHYLSPGASSGRMMPKRFLMPLFTFSDDEKCRSALDRMGNNVEIIRLYSGRNLRHSLPTLDWTILICKSLNGHRFDDTAYRRTWEMRKS